MKKLLSILFFAFMASTVVMSQESSASEASNSENITITVKDVAFTMVFVKGGTFQMGATEEQGSDAYDNEKPAHSVTLSDYYIGETEVTQALWEAVMGDNPLYYKNPNLPMEDMSWEEGQLFITKLNQLTGKKFRFPTEAEWEYAARGGCKSRGYKYAGSNDFDEVAWTSENSEMDPHFVKQKSPNELGIYDMSGNVEEWCQDWYDEEYYSKSPSNDPCNNTKADCHVGRGGNWNSASATSRVSYRNDFPCLMNLFIGIRLVL